ncbi:MAG TPA: AAA family ATPase [Candidatus Limnocylindrales bacterium]|nr:AAA family ATPase [Candidatus Limnocylindrales bacterium]
MGEIASPVFVGRQAELERLAASFTAAAAGSSSAAIVVGEAGIGKSRLVREACRGASGAGHRVLTGGCLPFADDPVPFAPIVEALRPLAGQLPPAVFDDLVGEWRTELATLMPVLGGGPEVGSGGGRGRLFELVLAFLGRLARLEPVALVIEDLQWADRSSLDLLAFLIHNARTTPLAIVMTLRRGELPRRHPLTPLVAELVRSRQVERIDLGPLDREAIADQVAGILGEPVDAAFVDRIFERSQGNPFFAEELVAAGGRNELPAALRDVLLAHVDVLSPHTRELLRVAAVGGMRQSAPVLARVLSWSDAEVRSSVRDAIDHGTLVAEGRPSPGASTFRHALIQEAILGDLTPDERVALHVAFAAALDELDPAGPGGIAPDVATAAERAYHWSQAGDAPRAFAAHIRAGIAAEGVLAFPEAERQFAQALDIHDRLPRKPPDGGLDEIELLERLARCASAAGTPTRAVEAIRRAIRLVDREAEPLRAGLLHQRLGRYLAQISASTEVIAEAREAVRLVPTEPPSAERVQVLAGLGQALLVVARHEEARDVSAAAIRAAASVPARLAEARAHLTWAMASGLIGDPDETLGAVVQACDLALATGDPELIGSAYWDLAYIQALHARRWRAAIATCLEGFAASERAGRVLASGGGRDLLLQAATSAWGVGDWPLADGFLDRAEGLGAETSQTASGYLYPYVRGLLALARGRIDEASRRVQELAGFHIGRHDLSARSEMSRIRAELALARGRPIEASEVMAAAVEGLTDAAISADADDLAELLAMGIRIEADVAGLARTHRDHAAVAAAADRAAGYLELMRSRTAMFVVRQPGRRRLSHAFVLSGEAELARLGRAAVDWRAVAMAWHDLDEPHREAYAWYREAETILSLSRRRLAAEAALRAAFGIAGRLGAATLLRDVENLGRRSRIVVDGVSAMSVAHASDAGANPAATGLTRRERDVLELLADGRTNREIGEHLFITEKTAGVHVSNILGKLGAVRRTEAAAIARRAGLI